MIKIVLKCALLALATGAIIFAMHAYAVWRLQPALSAAYHIDETVETLFVGSSQVGSAIEERPELKNRVVWHSDLTYPSFLLMLREMDARGELKHLKHIVIPFNHRIPAVYTDRQFKWDWLQELPTGIHHLDLMPCGWFEFGCFVLCNLRLPLAVNEIVTTFPQHSIPLSRCSDKIRRAKYSAYRQRASDVRIGVGWCIRWREKINEHVDAMRVIAERNGAELVIFKNPTLDWYDRLLTDDVHQLEEDMLHDFEKRGIRVLRFPCVYGADVMFDNVHFTAQGRRKFTDDFFLKFNQ